MSTAWLRLSRSCNNRCGFCLDAANLDDRRLSRADIENQIDELARRGTTRAILSGGEPTVSPLLVAALRRLRVRGIAASMTGSYPASFSICSVVIVLAVIIQFRVRGLGERGGERGGERDGKGDG